MEDSGAWGEGSGFIYVEGEGAALSECGECGEARLAPDEEEVKLPKGRVTIGDVLADDAKEVLADAATHVMGEVIVIWSEGNDIHYRSNGVKPSRFNWLLDCVKYAIMADE